MYFRFHKEVSAALIILFLLVVFFYFIYKPFFIILLILLIFTFYFFRDPERVVPLGDDILVSPGLRPFPKLALPLKKLSTEMESRQA